MKENLTDLTLDSLLVFIKNEPVVIFENPKGEVFIGAVNSISPTISYDKDFQVVNSMRISFDSFVEIQRTNGVENVLFEPQFWSPVAGTLESAKEIELDRIWMVVEKTSEVLHIKSGSRGRARISCGEGFRNFLPIIMSRYRGS